MLNKYLELNQFFAEIVRRFPARGEVSTFLITHLLRERPAFVRAVATQSNLVTVLPKPKSIDQDALEIVRSFANVDTLSRELFQRVDVAVSYLEKYAKGKDVLLLDIGGYYAGILNDLSKSYSGAIVGVVEDTENGLQRYLKLDSLPCPVFSVARSSLKIPEDYLVGQSIAYSIENLIRTCGEVVNGKSACVIGFGKLGSSIAQMLHSRSVLVSIYDKDPIKMSIASAMGYQIKSRRFGLSNADIIVGASGNRSLSLTDLQYVRNGAYIASVTSADDEFNFRNIEDIYTRNHVAPHVSRFEGRDKYFYLLAGGNAVNFVHGAVVGPYIALVQAGILAAASTIVNNNLAPGIYNVCENDCRQIAEVFLNHFN